MITEVVSRNKNTRNVFFHPVSRTLNITYAERQYVFLKENYVQNNVGKKNL